MLLGGDEMGRTQGGNNNAYCQDNEISWVDWSLRGGERRPRSPSPPGWPSSAGTTRCSAAGASSRAGPIHGETVTDIGWFAPDGTEMSEEDWDSGFAKSVGVFLNGDAIPDPDPRGEQITDDSFLLLFNAHHETLAVHAARPGLGRPLGVVLDTDDLASCRRTQAGANGGTAPPPPGSPGSARANR